MPVHIRRQHDSKILTRKLHLFIAGTKETFMLEHIATLLTSKDTTIEITSNIFFLFHFSKVHIQNVQNYRQRNLTLLFSLMFVDYPYVGPALGLFDVEIISFLFCYLSRIKYMPLCEELSRINTFSVNIFILV